MEKQTAIIFDLDGTLWDSAKEVAESWELEGRKVISPSFRFTEADSRAQMGKTMDEIVDSILPGESRERKAEVRTSICSPTRGSFIQKRRRRCRGCLI